MLCAEIHFEQQVAIAQLGERKTEAYSVILRPRVRFTVATHFAFSKFSILSTQQKYFFITNLHLISLQLQTVYHKMLFHMQYFTALCSSFNSKNIFFTVNSTSIHRRDRTAHQATSSECLCAFPLMKSSTSKMTWYHAYQCCWCHSLIKIKAKDIYLLCI